MLSKNILIAFTLAAIGMGNPLEKRNPCTTSTGQTGTTKYCPQGLGDVIPIADCIDGKLLIKNFLETLCSLQQPVIELNINVAACCVVSVGYCYVA